MSDVITIPRIHTNDRDTISLRVLLVEAVDASFVELSQSEGGRNGPHVITRVAVGGLSRSHGSAGVVSDQVHVD